MKKIIKKEVKRYFVVAIVEQAPDGNDEIVDFAPALYRYNIESRGEKKLAHYLAECDVKMYADSGIRAKVVEREEINISSIKY